MKVVIRTSGNSVSERVPAAVLGAAGLSLDQALDLRQDGAPIRVEPIHEPSFLLHEMLAAITIENRHDAIDDCPAVGTEAC